MLHAERLRRFIRELATGDWRDLASAQAALVAAQLAVWWRPRGTLVGRRGPDGAGLTGASSADATSPAFSSTLRRQVWALDRAARFGPIRPKCLVRAIALARLLAARGYPEARVRVGVYGDGSRLVAHAWVEYGGVVVGEGERDVSQFVPLSDAEVRL